VKRAASSAGDAIATTFREIADRVQQKTGGHAD
jgi:hypothetical protein